MIAALYKQRYFIGGKERKAGRINKVTNKKTMNLKKRKGFTLIELLVVVSVIAILASVVLVNLRGARESAMDSRIVSALAQARAVAEIIYSREGEYDDFCSGTDLGTDYGLDVLKADITENDGTIACFADGNDYCVSSSLNVGEYWCINSGGLSNATSSACTAADDSCG